MIKDIENGLINCVITKDLSRLGRNYLDCGLYLEVFFPEHNVRYIAVNDGVDTLNKSAMDITPFRNILNEMYSADVSVKIKSAYRARFQQGKFMGTTAPYGYVKDPADHNHLLIDDKVAHVVREIFDLALAGNGIAKIRKHINKQHILRPAAYAVEQGATGYERYFEDNEENRYIWSENSVRGILRSPIYAGNLAGYKRIAANMKSKKRPSKLPEEWEVIPDTHEGIVTQEEFDTVQQLMTSRRREQNAGGFENIFSGVIKCADCGYAMRAASANRRKRPDIIDCVQYTCNNYGRYGNVMCTAHSIEARDLFNAVLADINRFADMAVNDEKAVRAIERRLTETDQSRAKSLEKEKKKLNKRLAELDRLFSSLYEDKVMERITERNFEMMSGKYQKEQLEIEARLKEVTETLNDSYEKSQGVRDFLSLIRNYQGLKELDATIINALIDKILVSEREKLADGTVRQEIKIYYKFIGFVGELHITPTKRWTALKPKNCTVCGVEYVPSSGISKYCHACAKRIQREKSNESKRRSRERNRRACIELSAKNDRLITVANLAWTVANLATQLDAAWVAGDTGTNIMRHLGDIILEITGFFRDASQSMKDWSADLDFSPLLTSFDAVLAALGPVVGDIGDALLWLLNKCLLPLAKWGLESGLPAVFDLIAAALTALHSVLMAAEPTFDWMWNDFFQPIGQWTGELIIGALQKLTQALLRFSDWASQHKSTIQALTEVVIMFFAAWAVTTLVSHVGLMIANLGKLIGVLATTNIKFLAIVTVLTAVAGLAMKVAQAWTKMTPGERLATKIIAVAGAIALVVAAIGALTSNYVMLGVAMAVAGIAGLGISSIVSSANSRSGSSRPNTASAYQNANRAVSYASAPFRMPRLATGTVVPPRAGEFAAILGDNKRETEVVSPLSTMKQALKEALEESGAIGGGRDIHIDLILNGQRFASAVYKANNQERQRVGVRMVQQNG